MADTKYEEIRKLGCAIVVDNIPRIMAHVADFAEHSKENPYEYGYADMYAFSGKNNSFFDKDLQMELDIEEIMTEGENFNEDKVIKEILENNRKNKSFTYFSKTNQSWSYVIAVIKEYGKTTICFREIWPDSKMALDAYGVELSAFADKGDINSLRGASEIIERYSDSPYKDYPTRPNLDYIVSGTGIKYMDARDKGYIADVIIETNKEAIINSGFDLNKLLMIMTNLEISYDV